MKKIIACRDTLCLSKHSNRQSTPAPETPRLFPQPEGYYGIVKIVQTTKKFAHNPPAFSQRGTGVDSSRTRRHPLLFYFQTRLCVSHLIAQFVYIITLPLRMIFGYFYFFFHSHIKSGEEQFGNKPRYRIHYNRLTEYKHKRDKYQIHKTYACVTPSDAYVRCEPMGSRHRHEEYENYRKHKCSNCHSTGGEKHRYFLRHCQTGITDIQFCIFRKLSSYLRILV